MAAPIARASAQRLSRFTVQPSTPAATDHPSAARRRRNQWKASVSGSSSAAARRARRWRASSRRRAIGAAVNAASHPAATSSTSAAAAATVIQPKRGCRSSAPASAHAAMPQLPAMRLQSSDARPRPLPAMRVACTARSASPPAPPGTTAPRNTDCTCQEAIRRHPAVPLAARSSTPHSTTLSP